MHVDESLPRSSGSHDALTGSGASFMVRSKADWMSTRADVSRFTCKAPAVEGGGGGHERVMHNKLKKDDIITDTNKLYL